MESKKINQLATELAPVLSDLTIIGDPTTGISKKITLSQMASLFTGTVEEYPNLASFPLVGTADTIYIALDTNVLYRWNTGTNAYVELSPNIINSLVFNDANGFDGTIALVGSVATLTITTALTTGSVGFIGASGALLQDNANFFWDDTNNRLGIGTNAPTTAIDIFGSGIITRVNGTSTNNAFIGFASAGTNKWSVGNVQSDHRFRIYNEATTSELVSILSTGEFGIGIANPTTKFHIDGGSTALIANLDADVSIAKSVSFRSDNNNRFNIEVSGTESGSNAGANFFIRRYSDAGALLSTPLTITRSTGAIALTGALSGTTASFTGLIRTDLGAAGTSGTFTGTGSNFQINHDGSSAITLINSGGGGYVFKAGDLTTTIFSLSNAGAVVTTSITTSAYSYLYGLRISGNDTTNTIYSGAANMGITADSGYNIFIGQVGTTTTGLRINTTNGVATFSNSIGVGNSADLSQKLVVNQGATAFNQGIPSTTGTTQNGIFRLRPSTSLYGETFDFGMNVSASPYAWIQATNAGGLNVNYPLILNPNGGNVGINTSSPDVALLVGNTSTLTATANPTAIALDNSYFNGTTSGDKLKLYILRGGVNIGFGAGNIGDFNIWCDGLTRFYNGGSERLRISSQGYLKVSNAGTYAGATNPNHEIRNNNGGWGILDFSHTASSNPYGLSLNFSGASPNNGSNWMIYAQDSTNARFIVYSNGGISNFQANNTNLSDERTKKEIIPLESYWNKFKAIEIVKFKYKDQTHDDFNIGVIAQQVEKIAPEFIDTDGWEKPEYDEEGNLIVKEEEPLKSVYTADLHHATIKVLQEAMTKIETLEEKIKKLESK